MITVKIIKEGYGHKPSQVLTLNEFDAGHLMGFGYAENYVAASRVAAVIETQMVAPPETTVEFPEILATNESVIPKPVDAAGFFKRTYRKKRK